MANHTEFYEYEDFEIKIKRLGPGYGAVVESSVDGEVWIPLKLPFTHDAVDEILGSFEAQVLTSRNRQPLSSDPFSPQQIGRQLFDSLFEGEVLRLYQQRLADVQKEAVKRKGLRVVLNLIASELARLPWEFLYDTHRERYLSFRSDTPIVRRAGTELKPFTIDPPLRLLLFSAESADTRDLAVDEEIATIQGALHTWTQSGQIQIDVLPRADGGQLRKKMRAVDSPHVLHFIGHGGFNQLILKDKAINGESLAIVLDNTPSLRLVVLNACQAGAAGDSAARLGMAQRLAKVGIPATVAMQFRIHDVAARTFAGEFYRVLAEGLPVDVAVTWGRIAIQDKFGEAWGTPVLYMQAWDGRILRGLLPEREGVAEEKESGQKLEQVPIPPARDVEKAFYYEQGLACWDREEWAAALAFFQDAGSHSDAPQWVERARQKLQAKEEEERQQAYLATLYTQVQQHRAHQQWREAVYLLEQIVEADPTYRGEAGSARSLLKSAIEERDRVDRLHQKELQLQALDNQALQYQAQEQWSQVVKFLEEIERQQPGYGDVPQRLVEARRQGQLAELYQEGRQHQDQRDWTKAAEAFGKAAAIDSGYKDVYSLWEKARHEQRLDALLREGLSYLEQALWDEAIEALGEILTNDPHRREATVARYYAMGRRAIGKGQWDEAVQALQQVIAERRDYRGDAQQYYEEARLQLALKTEYRKAVTYQEKGQWRDAEAAFQRVEAKAKQLGYHKLEADDEKERLRGAEIRSQQMEEDTQPDYGDVAERLVEVREEMRLGELYQKAKRLLDVPDWEGAIQILKQIKPDYKDVSNLIETARQKRNLNALYNKGLDHYDRGRWQEAEEAFNRIVGSATDYKDAAQLLEETRRQLYLEKNYTEGIAYCERGIKNDDLGQLQLAMQRLQAVLDVQRSFPEAEAQLATAKRQYELLETFNAGQAAFQAGHWEEAIEAWRKVVATDPKYKDVTGKLEEAKRQRELERLYNQADSCVDKHQWAEAIAQFEKVLELDRGYRDAAGRLAGTYDQAKLAELYTRGKDHVEASRWDDAIRAFEEILELDSTYREAGQQLAQAQKCRELQIDYRAGVEAMNQENWGEAIRRLEAVVEAGGYEDAVHQLRRARRQETLQNEYQAGLACIKAEQWEEAIRHFDRVLQMDNKYLGAAEQRQHAQTQKRIEEQYAQALTFIEKEDWLLAEQMLMALIEKAPDHQEIVQRLEQVRRSSRLKGLYMDASEQLNKEQWKKAMELLEQVLEIASEHRYHDAKARLGEARQAYLKARYDEARKHLEKQGWADAVATFEEIWQMQPDYSDVQAQLENALWQHAEILKEDKRLRQATTVLRRLREVQERKDVQGSTKRTITTLRRFTDIRFPEQCKLYQPVHLSIQLTLKPVQIDVDIPPEMPKPQSPEPIVFEPTPEETKKRRAELLVVVSADSFEVDQRWRELAVPFDKDSEMIEFELIGQTLGPQIVEIEFFHGATRFDYFVVETEVVGRAPSGQDVQVTYEAIDKQVLSDMQKQPYITLIANWHKDKEIDYWIIEKGGLPIDGGLIPMENGEDMVLSIWEDLGEILGENVRLSNLSKRKLRTIWRRIESVGQELCEKLIPAELRSHSTTWPRGSIVSIATNEKWIPWELIHDGDDFWGDKFILARVPKIPGQSAFSASDEAVERYASIHLPKPIHPFKIVNVIGGELRPPSIVERVRRLFAAFESDARVEAVERGTLDEVLESMVGAGLVHFTCHGYTEPTPCLQLADDYHSTISCLTPIDTRSIPEISGSMVFANACQSTVISSFLGELRSFGWEFYKRGATVYIGTLGLVPTEYAVAFAERFYERLRAGHTVGESLYYAKSMAKRENPFWLLYALYGDPFARKVILRTST